MKSLVSFLSRMDKTAWRAIGVTCGLFACVIVVLVLGKTGALGTFEDFEHWLEGLRSSPWGLPALILVFCLSAFIGAPQFGLIAAAVVAFGPWNGFLYSWIATMVSGVMTFWLGRAAGEETFRRYAGETANRMAGFIGRNAFLASAIVRNVPTAPFIVVNMGFGVSTARFSHFLAGMALGIIPKTALVAFAGQSVMAMLGGSTWIAVATAVVAAVGWIGLMLASRVRLRAQRARAESESAAPQGDESSI